ncbi:tetratricopeptide repeat protein [Massilia sp. R2A-15]|uniref:tetratricopeptide repeat protein n=1 Tax=Massilia sp. R2A-15 TaxID=3064278 RepID=UPI002736A6E4|nr:tetratricopeptide repeat protein [Massilia sp. R2A-15]WLI89404.1 tetratricopeptide repeat protein [Massilia sp. R2A-15]
MSAISLHAGATEVGINAAGQVLLDRGQSLLAQGQVQQAFDAYREAAKADPASSLPDSMSAGLFGYLAERSTGDQRAKFLAQSLAFARSALTHNSADPIANELIRLAEQDAPTHLHAPTKEAADLVEAGESLFAQRRLPEALAKYELAAQVDPLYSAAWVFAGDCFYVEKRWAEAEARFRKAASIEPLNGQAWRFLSDALAQQGKKQDAQDALLSGIAAQPTQRPNWDKLDTMLRAGGVTMARLNLRRRASATLDPATHKPTVNLDKQLLDKPQGADTSFWTMYGMTLATAMAQKDPAASPFSLELQALRTALKVDADLQEKEPRSFDDPGLALLRKLGAQGQLETAILLLMYRESYRPEFEAWKKAHPNGVREFVLLQNVRP